MGWAREKAVEAGANARFDVGDAVTLSTYESCSFDFVFDGHCLHCIIGVDRRELLRNVCRILRPGGYFLIQTMCGPVAPEHIPPEHAPHYDPARRCLVYDGVAVRYWGDPQEIVAEVSSVLDVARYEILPRAESAPNADLVIESLKPSARA